MPLHRTGDAPIDKIYCACGGEIDLQTKKCKKCGKEYQPSKPSQDQTPQH